MNPFSLASPRMPGESPALGNLTENPHNGRGQKICRRSRKHGANAKLRKVLPPLGRQCPDAANLNSNGRKIREAAEREGRNRKGSRIERTLHRTEFLESNELVCDHTQ